MSESPSANRVLWVVMLGAAAALGLVLWRKVCTSPSSTAAAGGAVTGTVVPVNSNLNPLSNLSGSTQLAANVSGRVNLGLSTGFDVLTAPSDPGTLNF